MVHSLLLFTLMSVQLRADEGEPQAPSTAIHVNFSSRWIRLCMLVCVCVCVRVRRIPVSVAYRPMCVLSARYGDFYITLGLRCVCVAEALS